MHDDEPFDPDWCCAPSTTLGRWLADNNLTPGELATRTGDGFGGIRAALLIRDVLTQQPLLPSHANMLGGLTGTTTRFWLDRELHYRAALLCGKTDTTHEVGYPAGTTHLDRVITWGACPDCLIAYEAYTAWKADVGADAVARRCPLCGKSPDTPWAF